MSISQIFYRVKCRKCGSKFNLRSDISCRKCNDLGIQCVHITLCLSCYKTALAHHLNKTIPNNKMIGTIFVYSCLLSTVLVTLGMLGGRI